MPDGKPTTIGMAPAVIRPRIMTARDEAAAIRRIADLLVKVAWEHPAHHTLNVYKAAHVLLGGFPEFRRRCVRDMQMLARWDPGVAGRIDAAAFARLIWLRLRLRFGRFCFEQLGDAKLTPRKVIEIYEKHWVPDPRHPEPVPYGKEPCIIEEVGASAGIWDGWWSSALKREGNPHDIVNDLDLPQREIDKQHRMIEEQEAAERPLNEAEKARHKAPPLEQMTEEIFG